MSDAAARRLEPSDLGLGRARLARSPRASALLLLSFSLLAACGDPPPAPARPDLPPPFAEEAAAAGITFRSAFLPDEQGDHRRGRLPGIEAEILELPLHVEGVPP